MELAKRLKKIHDIELAMLVLKSIVVDTQFNLSGKDYTGFINTGIDIISDRFKESFKVFIANRDIFEPILKSHGLVIDKWDINETIIRDEVAIAAKVSYF